MYLTKVLFDASADYGEQNFKGFRIDTVYDVINIKIQMGALAPLPPPRRAPMSLETLAFSKSITLYHCTCMYMFLILSKCCYSTINFFPFLCITLFSNFSASSFTKSDI